MMLNNNKENKNKDLEINSNSFSRDCDYITVNFATGDQFRKITTLHSKETPITPEQVKKFYDEAKKEAQEWQKNHPGESVTIRVLQGEDDKQVIKVTPTNDLICPSNFRTRIYDTKTGKQIIGEENIRKEI